MGYVMGGERISRKRKFMRGKRIYKAIGTRSELLSAYKSEENGDYEDAFNKYLSSAKRGKDEGDRMLSAIGYFRAGNCAKRMGNISKAKELYLNATKSLMEAVEKNKLDKNQAIKIYRTAALYAMHAGRYKLAEELLRKSREIEGEK